jgi:hypothetical protein
MPSGGTITAGGVARTAPRLSDAVGPLLTKRDYFAS